MDLEEEKEGSDEESSEYESEYESEEEDAAPRLKPVFVRKCVHILCLCSVKQRSVCTDHGCFCYILLLGRTA